MHVGSLRVELRLPQARSLKAKRSVVTPILEGARRRHRVAASEVGDADSWQRTTLGFATVSGSARQVTEVLDAVERFVWSFPEIEVVGSQRDWLDAG